MAELLKQQGYATMAIGKWHLGDQPEFLPTRHGFDHYLGLPYSNDMGGTAARTPEGGGSRPPLPLLRDDTVIEAPADQDTLTARYTEEAVKFITANKDRPFFLYLPHTAVHVPLHPGAAFKGKSANGSLRRLGRGSGLERRPGAGHAARTRSSPSARWYCSPATTARG